MSGRRMDFFKKSYVIFICDYDEFGLGRHLYTFEKKCKEVPDLVLGDDTVVVILNAKGTVDDVNNEIKGLLDYIDGAAPRSNLAKSLDEEVKNVKSNEDWRRDFMMMNLLMRENQNIGSYKKVISQVKKNFQSMPAEQMSYVFDVNIDVINTILDNIDMDEEKLAQILVDLED